MNAKWLAHLLEYRVSEHRVVALQTLLREKIARQATAARRYKKQFVPPKVLQETNEKKLLLIEARYARMYWSAFARALPKWCAWKGRVPHGTDVANKLLDIGYHTLSLILQKKCEALNIPTEVGLLHRAQSAKAHPLVYDLMEPFRVHVVDEVLMTFFHMKKHPIVQVDQIIVQEFLHEVYAILHRQYYHRERRVCISFSYWIDLVLLGLRGAVSGQRKFKPLWTPLRHETRCNRKPPTTMSEV